MLPSSLLTDSRRKTKSLCLLALWVSNTQWSQARLNVHVAMHGRQCNKDQIEM